MYLNLSFTLARFPQKKQQQMPSPVPQPPGYHTRETLHQVRWVVYLLTSLLLLICFIIDGCSDRNKRKWFTLDVDFSVFDFMVIKTGLEMPALVSCFLQDYFDNKKILFYVVERLVRCTTKWSERVMFVILLKKWNKIEDKIVGRESKWYFQQWALWHSNHTTTTFDTHAKQERCGGVTSIGTGNT